ncbi:glutamate carboxypeptidase II [Malassezia sp. CBS 17886]|nr:glutamate carboxypeptidase II [Malassezia sp. CBS 17886]
MLFDPERMDDGVCALAGMQAPGADGSCARSHAARSGDWEKVYRTVPKAESVREALRRYTSVHHIAGERADELSALRTIEEWSSLLNLPEVRNASKLVFDAGSNESRERMTAHAPAHAPRVWADTYSVWLDTPVNASLSLAAPRGTADTPMWTADLAEDILREDPTSAFGMPPFHGYSGSGAAEGRIVYAGTGSKEDYARLARLGVHVRGCIVLVRYGGLFRGLKVRAAQEAGAVGVLIFSDPKEDGSVTEAHGDAPYPHGPAREPSSVQRGSVQALSVYPGDPATPGRPSYRNATRLPREEADTLPKIPSLPLSYTNARRILQSTEGRGVCADDVHPHFRGAIPGVSYWTGPSEDVARLENYMDLRTRDIWNVYAVIPGYLDDERIFLGNHRDAWTFGAADPSSGSAVVHEMLRGFGELLRRGWKPLRTIVVGSWDAEEYGLVGSTEFGEDYAEHVLRNVAMYHNIDVAVAGGELSMSASPSLAPLLRRAAQSVHSPDRGAQERLRPGDIAPLGSGSDFTVFLQRIGVASTDTGFKRGAHDPVYHYHSNFDSFRWMDRFGDPGFHRHVAAAQLFGTVALQSAQSAVLPLDLPSYTHALFEYYRVLRDVARASGLSLQGARLHRIRDAIDDVHAAVEDLDARARRIGDAVRTEPGGAQAARRAAVRDIRGVNAKLKEFESGFIHDKGLPKRPWYRHLGVAPGRWLGYGATTFPGVTESITFDRGDGTTEQVDRLVHALERIAQGLRGGSGARVPGAGGQGGEEVKGDGKN